MFLLIIGIMTAPSKNAGRVGTLRHSKRGAPTVARAGCALTLSLIYHRLEGRVNHNYVFLSDFFRFIHSIVIMHNFI